MTAIVDARGGHRVVVTRPEQLHFHLAPGELAYTVPDYWVWEPVPFELWPTVIGIAERHLVRATNRAHESNL